MLRHDNPEVRPEISLAWQRAVMHGLDPGMQVRETAMFSEFDGHSRLLSSAAPVIERIAEDLADTSFSVLLADRDARIVARRSGTRHVTAALDRVLAAPGARYLEEFTGTNSVATVHELHRPIAVRGDEHFLESMRIFGCFGVPIVHPATRRLAGIIDISGPSSQFSPLLRPYLLRAAAEVEQRLLEMSSLVEQRLLAEFQIHSRSARHALVVIGEDLVLNNRLATDLIRSADYAALRTIAAELAPGAHREQSLVLNSGATVRLVADVVTDRPRGVRFMLEPTAQSPQPPGPAPVARVAVVLVEGEPGTGRTTAARALAGATARYLDVLEVRDQSEWLDMVRSLIEGPDAVVLDNIHLLTPALAGALTPLVRRAQQQVVLTSSPVDGLEPEQAALAATAGEHRSLRPVREYHHDFARLAIGMLREMNPGSRLALSASAIELLAGNPWPGNLRELRGVLHAAARGRTTGDIVAADLPPAYRCSVVRRLTPVESAERVAIVAALRAANGNKARAAVDLGIGRTTLYSRLRQYRITG